MSIEARRLPSGPLARGNVTVRRWQVEDAQVHIDFTGRGVMTAATALLTDAAFSVPEIELVEIHHDRANLASAGVPRRLGYTLVREVSREPRAPADAGVECQWRLTRGEWVARRGRAAE